MFFFILIIIIFYYQINKLFRTFYVYNTFDNINTNEFKILTYNIQRLPYLFRPELNINNLLESYDIICLQENFCPIFGFNKVNYTSIIPSSPFYKIVNSGLSIYSKYPIEYIDFVKFDNLKSIDRMSDKGFLVVKILDTYIINTHLQACYNFKEHHINETNHNLHNIIQYCKKYKKVLICGDFNLELNNLIIDDYNKIVTNEPTHWHSMNSIFNESSATKKDKYYPFYFDGGIYKNLNINNIKTVNHDIYTDHLGVSFNLIL